jgi:hypothetical protein
MKAAARPRREHKFVVRHQAKQRILLRALEEMTAGAETPEESAVVTEMIIRLEELLERRQKRVRLPRTVDGCVRRLA